MVFVRIREAQKEIPPVINQGHHAGHEAAAFEIMGGEATPSPLILQFIEIVLGVRALAIELGCGTEFVVG
jgi:hypothetical protein